MTDPAFEARLQVSRAVNAMTGNQGDSRSQYHDPLSALGALAALGTAVARSEQDAARSAREGGKTWGEIGEALGLTDRPRLSVVSVAERAFRRFASELGSGPVLAWTCGSCGHLITDRGPVWAGAEDAEQGHGDGCERFAAVVAAWDAQWNEGDDRDE